MTTWTINEINFLKDNYLTMSTKELAQKLNRDYSTTKRQLARYVFDVNEQNLPEGFVELDCSPIHAINRFGQVIRIRTRRTIKAHPSKKGYPTVCLQNKQSKRVHRLVAETFIPNPRNLPQVNHIDGDKTNNHVSNLEWCTNDQNRQHAMVSGLWDNIGKKVRVNQIGEFNSSAVLNESDVFNIYNQLLDGVKVTELARTYQVNHATISAIKSGKSWKHLYSYYQSNVQRLVERRRLK